MQAGEAVLIRTGVSACPPMAMLWIRATIQEYILRSWSLVKIAASASQKKLFFKLRRAKSAISALQDRRFAPRAGQD